MSRTHTKFRKLITRFCQLPGLAVPVVILGVIMAFLSNGDRYITFSYMWLIAASLVICYIIGSLLKFLYYKERPIPRHFSNRREKIDASSFPSIHTAQATIFLAYAVLMSKLLVVQIILGVVFGAFYVLIGDSRVFLKKHFIVDILIGTALGVAVVLFSLWQIDAIIGLGSLIFKI